MKHKLLVAFASILLFACASTPKNFTYRYNPKNTGLENRINVNGYYISEHGCDSAFYSVFMFYPDGLFTIATTSKVDSTLINCFAKGGKGNVCEYPLWGVYRLTGDTIKTQSLRQDGGGCVIFRDYQIMPDKSIVNLSDYVEPQFTMMGYMKNYPSFRENVCPKTARFLPLKSKRSVDDCPFIRKKWFLKKQ